MLLYARHDSDPLQERHYQVPRPSDHGGIKAALRESFKASALPAEISKLLSRLN